MTAPGQPRVLADVGGLVVVEDGSLIVVVDRHTGSWATLAFVLGVLTIVFGGFGIVALGILVKGSVVGGGVAGDAALSWPIAPGSLALGALAGAALWATIARIRRVNRSPLGDHRPVAVFDRARGVFLDADGSAVAPLDQVRILRESQATSSSAMLVALTPSGRRILKRGNPFDGGLGNLDQVLTTALFGPQR